MVGTPLNRQLIKPFPKHTCTHTHTHTYIHTHVCTHTCMYTHTTIWTNCCGFWRHAWCLMCNSAASKDTNYSISSEIGHQFRMKLSIEVFSILINFTSQITFNSYTSSHVITGRNKVLQARPTVCIMEVMCKPIDPQPHYSSSTPVRTVALVMFIQTSTSLSLHTGCGECPTELDHSSLTTTSIVNRTHSVMSYTLYNMTILVGKGRHESLRCPAGASHYASS